MVKNNKIRNNSKISLLFLLLASVFVSVSACATDTSLDTDYYFNNNTYTVTPGEIVYAADINDPFSGVNVAFNALMNDIRTGDGIVSGTDTGVANAYVINLDPALSAYVEGQVVWLKVLNTNTGDSTLNINALGAVPIKNVRFTQLYGGELGADYYTLLKYTNGTFIVSSETSISHEDAAAAAASAAAALVSENNAASSETAAGISETNSGNSETAAGISETNSAASEITASISAAAALVSENNADSSETASAASAAAASTSEINANNSEAAAAASEVAAALSEGNAANSETNAGNSETAAAASATSASSSATEAETHKDAAYQYSQDAASAVAYQDLASSNEILATSANIVAVFDYFVADDSDGGEWTKRMQDKSWYTETLNTATRGATRDFPAHVKIVAETDKVTLFDATQADMPMWMVFLNTGSQTGFLSWAGPTVGSSGIMSNGVLVPVGNNGGIRIDFTEDESVPIFNSAYTITSGTRIVDRNSPVSIVAGGDGYVIVNTGITAVTMTVLPEAPIGQTTGIAVPTIAVGTDGGVSVIDGTAGVGTVVDLTNGTDAMTSVDFASDGSLWIARGVPARILWVFNTLPLVDATMATRDQEYLPGGIPSLMDGISATRALSNRFQGRTVGLAQIFEDPTTPENGMVNYTTDSYISGIMQGDIKGAWLADSVAGVLIDTTDVEDRSVNDNPLTVVGTGLTRTAVVTDAELMWFGGFSVTDWLEQAYNSDLEFDTGDFTIPLWLYFESSATPDMLFQRYSATDGATTELSLWVNTTTRYLRSQIGGTYHETTYALPNQSKSMVTLKRISGVAYLIINDVVVDSWAAAGSVTMTNDAVFSVGNNFSAGLPATNCKMALLRISDGATSAEQDSTIYNNEKQLFDEGAKYLLPSANVQSLDYDLITDTLLVGTDSGAQKRKGLLNVEDISDANLTSQNISSVSLNRGSYTISSAAEAVAYTPSVNLKDEIARSIEAYTKFETDALLLGKSDTDHLHDDRYYTETETDTLLDTKVDVGDVFGTNLLVNSNFDVNQESYVSGSPFATGEYGHDMWKADPDISGHADSGYSWTSGYTREITPETFCGLEQINDDLLRYVGETVTVSVLSGGVSVADNSGPVGNATASSPLTFVLDITTVSGIRFGSYIGGGFSGLKVSPALESTRYEVPNITDEELRSYRYFWKLEGTSLPAIGVAENSGTSIRANVKLPCNMSSVPSVNSDTLQAVGGSVYSATPPTFNNIIMDKGNLEIGDITNWGGALGNGSLHMLSTTGYIEFDARY